MIEPGFPVLLAHPALAFVLCIAAFAGAVALIVRAAARRGATAQAAYWQALALVSEVLLALGLIGLAVFGGRLAMTSNTVMQAQRLGTATELAEARAGNITATYCAASARALAPYNPGVAASELCAIVRQHALRGAGAGAEALQVTAAALRDFGQRYPGCVDNVFSRNNDCERTVAAAASYASAIDAVFDATLAQRHAGSQLLAVQASSDSGFALAALFLAAAGLAIRIARAAQPYWPARFSSLR